MRCTAARALVHEGLEGTLSPVDEAMVEAHVHQCDGCRRYAAHLRRSIGALEDLSRQAAPMDFGTIVGFQLRRERVKRNWMPPVAIAAAVLVGVIAGGPGLHQVSERAALLQHRQLAADEATAEFMHWMDPSADGVSGLAVQQAAFETAQPFDQPVPAPAR